MRWPRKKKPPVRPMGAVFDDIARQAVADGLTVEREAGRLKITEDLGEGETAITEITAFGAA